MALVFIDGFDGYGSSVPISSKWPTPPAVSQFQTGRFGGQSLSMSSQSGINLTSGTGWAVGVAVKLNGTISTTAQLISLRNGTTLVGVIGFNSLNQILAATTSLSSPYASSSQSIAQNAWNYIEWVVNLASTGGTSQVFLNGQQIINFTGNTGSGAINNLLLGNSNSVSFNFDDFYVSSGATRIGEARVETLAPASNDAVQWTPNGNANNFGCVNELPWNGDTTYISSSTPGQQDTFNINALSSTPLNIFAVQVTYAARKDDANTRTIAGVLKSGAASVVGANNNLASTYQVFSDIYANDPNTSAPWSAAAVNAAKIGVREVV